MLAPIQVEAREAARVSSVVGAALIPVLLVGTRGRAARTMWRGVVLVSGYALSLTLLLAIQ